MTIQNKINLAFSLNFLAYFSRLFFSHLKKKPTIFCYTEFNSLAWHGLMMMTNPDQKITESHFLWCIFLMFQKRVLEIVLLNVPLQLYVDLASLKFLIWQMYQGCPWQLSYVRWLSFDFYSLSIYRDHILFHCHCQQLSALAFCWQFYDGL